MEHDLLMVAREAVSNAALHGNPSRVEVGLAYSKRELQLNVSDDGTGPIAGNQFCKQHAGFEFEMEIRPKSWCCGYPELPDFATGGVTQHG